MHLAAPAVVNRTYLSKLEKGASNPGLAIIAKLVTVPEVERVELGAELLLPLKCASPDESRTEQGKMDHRKPWTTDLYAAEASQIAERYGHVRGEQPLMRAATLDKW